MEFVEVDSKKLKKLFIDFIYGLYKDDKNFCDMNLLFVKNFLYQIDSYSKRCTVRPIMITDGGEIKLECIYVVDEKDVIKLSFIEFRRNASKYLQELIAYSKKVIKEYGKKKVVVGINGQVSYGLGILTNNYNRNFEFNSNYNLDYYAEEMDAVFPVMKRAFSYNYAATHSLSMFDNDMLKQVYDNFQFRYFNVHDFKKEMLLFGQLCHESLKKNAVLFRENS